MIGAVPTVDPLPGLVLWSHGLCLPFPVDQTELNSCGNHMSTGFPFVLSLLFHDLLSVVLVLKFITTKESKQIFFLTNIPEGKQVTAFHQEQSLGVMGSLQGLGPELERLKEIPLAEEQPQSGLARSVCETYCSLLSAHHSPRASGHVPMCIVGCGCRLTAFNFNALKHIVYFDC